MKTLNDVVELLKKKGYEAELNDDNGISITNANISQYTLAYEPILYGWIMSSSYKCTSIYYESDKHDDTYNKDVQKLYDWVSTIPDVSIHNTQNHLGASNPFDLFGINSPFNMLGQIHGGFNMPIVDDRDHSSMYPVKHVTYDCLPWYNGESCGSIIASISDSDGNLDVDAAKAKFGSCKKALKAVIKAYNAESKSMASVFAAKEKMNQSNKGYGE